MDQHPEKFGRVVLEADLELSLDVMHTRKRHLVGQRAVARDIKAGAHSLELEVMQVHYFGKFLHDIF